MSSRTSGGAVVRTEVLEDRRLFSVAIVGQQLIRPARAAADLNGDGKADLAEVTVGRNSAGATTVGVDILINNGDGSFTKTSHVDCTDDSTGTPLSVDIATGDVNGDGQPDIVLKLFSVTGQPTPVGSAVKGEYQVIPVVWTPNSDGTPGGSYAPAKTFVVPHVLEARRAFVAPHVLERDSLYVGDVNGDKRADIVSVVGNQVVTAYSTSAGRAFTVQDGLWDGTVKGSGRTLGVADIDGDGRSDLVGVVDGTVSYARFNDGSDASSPPGFGRVNKIDAITVNQKANLWLVDATGDGSANDIAIDEPGTTRLAINDHGRYTVQLLSSPVVGNPSEILVGDLDGDGKDELFTVKEKNKGTGVNGEGKKEYVGHVTLLK